MKPAGSGPQMITANRLRDGAVVFLAEDGRWSSTLQDGRVAHNAEAAQALVAAAEAAVQQAEIVGPYLVAVQEVAGRWVPLSYRERIRAEGPSLSLGVAVRE